MTINDTLRYLHLGLPQDIAQRKAHGDLKGALRLIDRRLADEATPAPLRHALTAHREIIERLPKNFPVTYEAALAEIRSHIPDFEASELDELIDQRKLRWIYIDGEMHFCSNFFRTLCKANPAFADRAGVKLFGSESLVKTGKSRLDPVIEKMRANGKVANRIRMHESVRLKDEHFTPGMFLRVHLPLPIECDTQSDIVIEKIYPEGGIVAPADSLSRTICWEKTMEENDEFVVEYSFIHTDTYHDVSAIKADKVQPDFCTGEEAPHIVFTPYVKALVKTLTEGVDDPLEKARIFYDYLTLNVKYTFMPNYFVEENIVQNCLQNLNGDCGVYASTFVTLCRCAGIPAQWQSGLSAEPGYCSPHDWARFYIAPYGWLYADCSFGGGAVRANNEMRRRHYFGNLDGFRIVAANAFQQEFDIPKQHWRADPYDNQQGEMESAERGFDYEEFTRVRKTLACDPIE